jgi:hypothetical protein
MRLRGLAQAGRVAPMTRRPSHRFTAPAVEVVASVTRSPIMPYRHWFVVLTTDEGEYRSGPYPSRRAPSAKLVNAISTRKQAT